MELYPFQVLAKSGIVRSYKWATPALPGETDTYELLST